MRLSVRLLIARGRYRLPTDKNESERLIKYGERKWRDYQSDTIEPPYWYKWTTESPYSPTEQHKIRTAEHVDWYRFNFQSLKIVPPDEWLFKVGDKVEILVGKDIGKQGEVIQVVPQGNIIVVGGLNCEQVKGQDDMWMRKEKPLQHHEVSLLDPKDSKPVEIEFRVNESGQRVRVSKRSGYLVHWPPELLWDGTPKNEYTCQSKDTTYEAACENTYKPTLDSWQDELKKLFNISDPERRKTYWY
uniref:Large ribosomal subunit protein uL24m n=1 Tax=Ciona savignyi TaxID=51511 RepID=H2YKH4_CIOSA